MKSGLYDAGSGDAPNRDEPASVDVLADDAAATLASRRADEPRVSLWRGVVLGLLATAAGLGVAELFVGLIRGSSSPVVPVGQEFIDVTPKWLKDWAIEQFGTSDNVLY